jgi:cell division septation protein DedD
MKSKTVLVIENDMDTSRLISKTLESAGYLVFTASRGTVGLTMAKKIKPSLIFLNISTPDTEGLKICSELKKIERLSDVPVMLLTGGTESYDPRYKTSYGIVDFLKKPVVPDELVKKTDKVFSGEPEKAEEVFAVEELEPSGAAEEKFSMEEARAETAEAFDEGFMEQKDEMEEAPPEGISFKSRAKEPLDDFLEEEKEGEMKAEEQMGGEPSDYGSDILKDTMKNRLKRRGAGGAKKAIFAVVGLALMVIGLGAAYLVFWPKKEVKTTPPAVTVAPAVSNQPALPAQAQKPAAVKPAAKPEQPQKQVAKVEPKPGAIKQPAAAKPAPKPEATKQQAAAKPAPKVGAAPKAAKKFSVQVGAFGSKANAEVLVNRLKGKGYDAFIQEGTKAGGTIYRVLVGSFDSRKEAAVKADEIKGKEKMGAIVY